jgi:hypothetical protein
MEQNYKKLSSGGFIIELISPLGELGEDILFKSVIVGHFAFKLEEVAVLLEILLLNFVVFGLVNEADSHPWVDENELSLINFDPPVPNQQVPVNLAHEVGHKDPVVGALDAIIVAYDDILISIYPVGPSENDVVVLGELSVQIQEVLACQDNSLPHFHLVLAFGTQSLQGIIQLVDRIVHLEEGFH